MASQPDLLILGLGNPGSKYSGNRHNIGWMVAAALCERRKRPIMPLASNAYVSSVRIAGRLAVVALPTTYMNNSGEAALDLLETYDLKPENILVIFDEYNFPIGKIHLRKGGGDGGHNGVENIIYMLQSEDFYRLRCGIDRNFGEGEMPSYVLSDFEENEIRARDEMISKAADAIEFFFANPPGKALSFINSGRLWKPKDPENDPKEAKSEDISSNNSEK